MRLIIEIPEEIVKAIQNGKDYRYDIHTAIAQGTPLPKIHGRLIDEAEITECDREDGNYWVTNAPSIINADRRSEEE